MLRFVDFFCVASQNCMRCKGSLRYSTNWFALFPRSLLKTHYKTSFPIEINADTINLCWLILLMSFKSCQIYLYGLQSQKRLKAIHMPTVVKYYWHLLILFPTRARKKQTNKQKNIGGKIRKREKGPHKIFKTNEMNWKTSANSLVTNGQADKKFWFQSKVSKSG